MPKFLTILEKGLPDDPYKDRLLRELSDHLKDSSSKQDPAEAEERLGDPHEFITFYQMVMRKNWQLYLEALFIGLCSMPLILLPFIGNAFTETTESLPAKVVLWVFTLGCEAFLYFSFYRWVWARLGGAEKIHSGLAKRLFPLLTLPSWCTLGLVAFFLVMVDQGQDHYYPLVLGSYAAVQGIAAWKARTQSFSEKETRRIAVLGFALVVALFVMLPALSGTPLQEALFTLFFFVRVGLFLPFGGEYAAAFITLGVLALFMIGYSFLDVFQKQWKGEEFAWGKALIGLFLLYGFVTPPVPSDLIWWNYNTVNLTQTWEQDRLGIFYRWYLFLTKNGERTFQYVVEERDGKVRITDQSDQWIEFDGFSAADLEWKGGKTENAFQIAQGRSFFTEIDEEGAAVGGITQEPHPTLLVDFRCENSDAPEDMGKVLILGVGTYCKSFYYKDQVVFSSSVDVLVQDAFVTADGQWLILHFPEQAWGPGLYQHDSVFAVELDASFN